MTDPVQYGVGEVAVELYDSITPGQVDEPLDPQGSTPDDLLNFCDALGGSLEEWWAIVQADWDTLLDPELTPASALNYLAQFVGTVVNPTWTEAQLRTAIARPSGFERGTLAAMTDAIQRTLTGDKQVWIEERVNGFAYRLFIRTLTVQTPSVAATTAAILLQKPAGLLLDYATYSGQTFSTLDAAYTSFTNADTAYKSFTALQNDETI